MPDSTAIVYNVTRNHLPMMYASAAALEKFNPEVTIYACVVDELPGEAADDYPRVPTSWFEGKTGRRMLFQYTGHEASCLSKFHSLKFLMTKYDRVLCLDTDIHVVAPLETYLNDCPDAGVVLTLHHNEPMTGPEAAHREALCRKSGLINSGMILVRPSDAAEKFLDYGITRLSKHALMDQAAGYFCEQAWCDYGWTYFPGVDICRHPGVNVAWWNNETRPLSIVDGAYQIGESPLLAYHWSGYQAVNPSQLCKYFPKQLIPEGSPLEKLAEDWRNLLLNNQNQHPVPEYKYNTLSDGTPIKHSWREAVRGGLLDLALPVDPFQANPEWLDQLKAAGKKCRYARSDWKLAAFSKLRRKPPRWLRTVHRCGKFFGLK
jgi:hypothetical protein